jgi:beta-lactam-binding protein with PASTA domain
MLESAGFTVKATGQVFSKLSQRTVTKQTPAAGTATTRGTVVTCNIQ